MTTRLPRLWDGGHQGSVKTYQLGFFDYKEVVFTCFPNLYFSDVEIPATEEDDATTPNASYLSHLSIDISSQLFTNFCTGNLLLLKIKWSSFVTFGVFLSIEIGWTTFQVVANDLFFFEHASTNFLLFSQGQASHIAVDYLVGYKLATY